ncbi:helix-turn-helix domain-containing protein [Pleionea sp. CnH1-48]|uniref:AraC family transcriptional regulator n=1 Tax=Pleionea sp. CnH1-48 TaxID=2954494 RepID=UPI00209743B7|nr:helix-turn-helix domain-containing protein [Pleionea sp. CnH1-48]MCO7225350.1 helix-turn-helix domain-containing protein [Pleionea sp. CnH1-48]
MKINNKPIKGVLNRAASEGKSQLTRLFPEAPFSYFIEQYWHVSWNLSSPHTQQNLPHPCVNLAFEPEGTRVLGPVSQKFSYQMEGSNWILGVKFHPGAFYSCFKIVASEMTDQSFSIEEIWGEQGRLLESRVRATDNVKNMIDIVEDFFSSTIPSEPDEQVGKIKNIIDTIAKDRDILKVEDLLVPFDMNKRKLQRLFERYVGVSPKWVIRKYRLHEVLERLENQDEDVYQMIYDLGYSDQSHFIKDFKTFVGISPGQYMKDKLGDCF